MYNSSLRKYNRQILRRTRIHPFTSKDIASEMSKAIYGVAKVNMLKLSEEDLKHYRKNVDNAKFEKYLENKYQDYYQPPSKKFKPIENEKRPDNLKVIFSREGETDTFKAQFKSDLRNHYDSSASTSSASASTSSASACSSPESTSTTSISDESSLPHSTPDNTLVNDLSIVVESEQITKCSKPQRSYIKVRGFYAMMNENLVKRFLNNFNDVHVHGRKLPTNIRQPRITQVSGSKKIAPKTSASTTSASTTSASTTSASTLIRGKVSLSEIEQLYRKYFSKKVQNTVLIIANILNLISVSNKHHKSRMDESFKKRSEAEKLKERCDANRMHIKHKNVLESALKDNFTFVVTLFSDSDFEVVFQMFFLSILTVLRVLDQPKFKKGSIFKNLVLLLWNSLKNTKFEHPKVFPLFKSKTFRPDCIDLISLIEDSRDGDPGITDRMSLFFVSTINTRHYFQNVIDALTGNSREDLETLLSYASLQCRLNSKFKDPNENLCNVKNICINKAPVSSVQSVTKSNDGIRWVLAPQAPQSSNGIIQTVQLANENQVQVTASNTTVEHHPTPGSSKPLNTYYGTFSNNLSTNVSSESTSSNVSAPKLVVVSSPSSNGSIGQLVTLRPIQKPDSGTIILGNKQFQLIKTAPLSQVRSVNTQGTNSIVIKPMEPMDCCCAKNCNKEARIMCGNCRCIKYCDKECQHKDWYANHIKDCDRIISIRQSLQ